MAVDFRNPEEQVSAANLSTAKAPVATANQGHQIAFIGLIVAALAMLLAGVWIVAYGVPFLPASESPLIGIALAITGLADIGVAIFLRRHWARTPR